MLASVPGVIASVSLLVSVQTHLLDTCPRIGVSSQIPADEIILIAIGDNGEHRVEPISGPQQFPSGNESLCIVRRPKNASQSYVEIMESSDFRDLTIARSTDDCTVEWELFADFLEKGVIRRARVHTAFLPCQNDIELAAICCDAAHHLQLPLTT
jgi:hypothetical protein